METVEHTGKIRSGDTFLLQDLSSYVEAVEELSSDVWIVRDYLETANFFNSPLPSKDLYIVQTSGEKRDTTYIIDKSFIFAKCYRLPFENDFVLIPLL